MAEIEKLPSVDYQQHPPDRRRRFSNVFNSPEELDQEEDSSSLAVALEEHSTSLPQEEGASLRRSSRKLIRRSLSEIPTSSVSTKPIKLGEKNSSRHIEKYYLDKRVKRLNPSLETIYEEPQVINNEQVVMSNRKFKRVINFGGVGAKNGAKVRKRKLKAKSVVKKKGKKVSLKFLMDTLNQIDE